MEYYNKYIKYKTKYLELQNNNITGGGVVQNNRDTGAGVLLLEDYRPNTGTRRLTVILFKDRYKKMYTDGGGTRDRGENLKDTARRELKEESANLFRLSKGSLHDSIAVRKGQYVGYLVKLKSPIMSREYYNNLRILQTNRAPREWLETDSFKRVYIDDFIRVGGTTKPGDLTGVPTTDGSRITIFGRTKALLREAINSGLVYRIPTITPNVNKNYISRSRSKSRSRRYLNGTYTYWT